MQSGISGFFSGGGSCGGGGSGGSSSGGGSSSAYTTPSSNQLGKRDSHMSITMDPGLALREASLPPGSKKRKTCLALEEAATESPVCRQQQLKDSNSNEEQIFKRAKGDISRTKAALKDLLHSKAIQPYLPAGFTAKDSEADEVACGIGVSVVDLVLAIKQKGASATSMETTLKELVIALAVAEVGPAKAIRAFKYDSNPKVVYEIAKFAEKAASSGENVIEALVNGKLRAPRADKSTGDTIFLEIWHHYTEQVKGKRGSKRKYDGSHSTLAQTMVIYIPICHLSSLPRVIHNAAED